MMPQRFASICFLASAIAGASPYPAAAQANRTPVQLAAGNDVGGGLVRVMVDAPIYVQPDSNRDPLRVAKEGSVLRFIRTEGAFAYVEFADPEYPRRYGYIRSQAVEPLAPPRQEPLDLTVPQARQNGAPTPAPPARPAAAPITTQAARDPSLVQQPAPAAVVPEQARAFRPRGAPRRGWLDIDAVRFHSVDRPAFSPNRVGILYGEGAGGGALYRTQDIDLTSVGLSGGFGFQHGLGFALSFDGENYTEPVTLAVVVPSPYFTNLSAVDATTLNSVERRERALDISAEYVIPSPNWLRLRVFGGPTYFHITNAMVTDIQYSQVASSLVRLNVVAIRGFTQRDVTGSALGYHAGLDGAYFFSRHVGVGGGARFNRGTVTVLDPISDKDTGLRVGHLSFNGGLRLRF